MPTFLPKPIMILSLVLLNLHWTAAAQTPNAQEGAVAKTGASREVPRKTNPRKPSTSASGSGGNSVSLLGSVATSSPAESFALNGNYAYVCDDSEVTVVNIANPANLQIVGTATSTQINNTSDIHCAVRNGALSIFSDQASTTIGNTPGFVSFSLANPLQPQVVQATSINKRFFQDPVYIGNLAYVPTAALVYSFGQWDAQFGDLLAVDLTNPSAPVVTGTLEQPQLNPVYGGGTVMLGATQADTSLIYMGGSSSTSNTNTGKGRLQVVDVSTPSAMKVIAQVLIPGSVHFWAPQLQGTVGVGIGNTGGYGSNGTGATGNIVLATFDVSDRRSPSILYNTVTTYKVGHGGGSARIGNFLFAFAGVLDSNNNEVLLIVNIGNPEAPIVTSFPLTQPFSNMQAVGTTLFATQGAGGFAAYSIPGISAISSLCPVSTDMVLMVDSGSHITAQALLDGKAALKTLVDSLRLTPDQVAVGAFTNTASIAQTLTVNATISKAALDAIATGSNSYIGAGIAAAQAELTGTRHNPSAIPILVILSDGADLAAPNNTATITAANAAKAAGIRIISIQYGSSTGTLMQSIASSNSDYYLVAQ